MDQQSVWETLTDVFRETFDEDTIELSEDMTANDIEDWDSITHVQLMVAVEQAFNIRISTGEVANLSNVGQLVRLIQQRLGI